MEILLLYFEPSKKRTVQSWTNIWIRTARENASHARYFEYFYETVS